MSDVDNESAFNNNWALSEGNVIDSSFNPRAEPVARPHTSPGTFHERADLFVNTPLNPSEDYRTKPEYHAYYYSLNPRDPRLPPPLKPKAAAPSTSMVSNLPPPAEPKKSPSLTHQPYQPVTPEFLPKNLLNSPEVPSMALPKAAETSGGFTLTSVETTKEPPKSSNPMFFLPQQQQQQQPSLLAVGQRQQVLLPTSNSNNTQQSAPITFNPYAQPQHSKPPAAGSQQLHAYPQVDHSQRSRQPREPRARTTQPASLAHAQKPKSDLLMNFLDQPQKNWQLDDIKGSIVEFSQDQDGSRLIQRFMEDGNTVSALTIFAEVKPALRELVTDVFGNYVVQKLLESGIREIRDEVVESMRGDVLTLSLQTYGCRVVQKAFDHVDFPQQLQLATELDGSVPQCVLNQNANHVIQKCIERMPDNCQFIIDSFKSKVLELSCHAYGCRVLQRVFEKCHNANQLKDLLDEVLQNTIALVADQYGNYVVQHALINSPRHIQAEIIRMLAPQIKDLACSKFASNVAEKIFEHSSTTELSYLLKLLMQVDASGTSALVCMMQDQFANYVVQRLIKVATPQQRQDIVEHITPRIHSIRKYTYGRHILARLEKMGLLIAGGDGQQRAQGHHGEGPGMMPIGMASQNAGHHMHQHSHHQHGHSHHQHHAHHQNHPNATHNHHTNHSSHNSHHRNERGGFSHRGGRGGRGRGGRGGNGFGANF